MCTLVQLGGFGTWAWWKVLRLLRTQPGRGWWDLGQSSASASQLRHKHSLQCELLPVNPLNSLRGQPPSAQESKGIHGVRAFSDFSTRGWLGKKDTHTLLMVFFFLLYSSFCVLYSLFLS